MLQLWSEVDSCSAVSIIESFADIYSQSNKDLASDLSVSTLLPRDFVTPDSSLINNAKKLTYQFGICLVCDFLNPASFKILPTSTKNISDSLTMILLSLVELFNIEKTWAFATSLTST